MRRLRSTHLTCLGLLLLTLTALLVHGYHPAAEDGEIYIPGIKKILDPTLYPFGAEFFQNHAKMTLFGRLIATSMQLSHLPFDTVLFVWYLASIFLTLLACWQWSSDCFSEPEARWAAVLLMASLLTLPVAGTSLYIADQYLTPRSVVLFAVLFGTRYAWRKQYSWFILWSVFAAAMHPLMAAFGISFALLLLVINRIEMARSSDNKTVEALVTAGVPFVTAASPAYEAAVRTRSYFFILQWEWYEWVGIFAPLLLLWWFGRIAERNGLTKLRALSRAFIMFELVFFAAALVLTIPPPLETLARLQPMRSLHLLYTGFIVLGGGIIGKYVLKRHAWRWVLLFAPLCIGMWFAQRQLFPTSAHIEWPGKSPQNDWLRAFDWIRSHTPTNAVFAIDPEFMRKDDQHGFRAIAERSRLADAVKDSGAVTMFPEPPMAQDWLQQTTDLKNWDRFDTSDFLRLKKKYGTDWLVLENPRGDDFHCPYQNTTLRVCRID